MKTTRIWSAALLGALTLCFTVLPAQAALIHDIVDGNGNLVGLIEVSAQSGGKAEIVTADVLLAGVQFDKFDLVADLAFTNFSIDNNWLLTGNFRFNGPFPFGGAIGGGYDMLLEFDASVNIDLPDLDNVAMSINCEAFNPPCLNQALAVEAVASQLAGLVPRHDVPEPTTIALLSLGLAGLGFGRRRSKKAA